MPTPSLASLSNEMDQNLVLRRAQPQDIPALIEFQARVHSDGGWNRPDSAITALVRDLLDGEVKHPTVTLDSFTVVEDTAVGQIVSATEIVPQTWSYAGIPFKVGRLELIGTHPVYRARGLARAQIEEQHRVSAAKGHIAQVIVGIPNFYRQFGYEMALPMGGGRSGFLPNLPLLPSDTPDPFKVREARESDLPFISIVYDRSVTRSAIWGVRTMDEWRYELKGRRGPNANRRDLRIITANDTEAGPVGYLVVNPGLAGSTFAALGYELGPRQAWYEITPSVLRWLWAEGQAIAARDGGTMGAFGLHLGLAHPAYEMVESRLPEKHNPYAFYMRVPNLPSFLNHISQALDERLASSSMAGYSGEIKISFYRSGITLGFLRGKLSARPYIPSPKVWTAAGFPGLTFLQLVFGYRSLEEILSTFPDAHVDSDETRAILRALFPKTPTNVWSLD